VVPRRQTRRHPALSLRPGSGACNRPSPRELVLEAGKFVRIPDRYGHPERSGLTWEVHSVEQTCHLDLMP
jgi:hypothetical protein